ncbi:S9 family peptidase [Candidatus Poribacteria bacterium]|nr:S9 family peptidase [Candidatus Poribacteria bacterium]
MKVHRHTPTITDTISFPFITEVAIAPGGEYVAYVVRTTDWKKNRYVLTCFLYNIDRNETRKIAENTWHPRWLNDNTLVVLHRDSKDSECLGNKSQIWFFNPADTSGMQITFVPHGIEKFWCYGNGIIYHADSDPNNQTLKREQRYGSYVHVGQEPRTTQLFYTDLPNVGVSEKASMNLPSTDAPNALRLTDGLDSSLRIRDLCLSSNTLYLNCQFQHDPDAICVWRLSAGPRELALIAASEAKEKAEFSWGQLDLPSNAAVMDVAPDGRTLLLNWNGGRSEFFSNEPWALWAHSLSSDASISDRRCLTAHFESQILAARWHEQGIYLHYIDGTVSRLARLDVSSQLETLDFGDIYPLCTPPTCFDISKVGVLTFAAGGAHNVPEVVVVPKTECPPTPSSSIQTISPPLETQQITAFNSLCEDWDWGTREVINWKSLDNTEIEGVLFKPTDFDPTLKYPLIGVVHGGPATAALELRLDWEDRWFYPTLQFLARGILVLKPNYRGSDGRGHAFLELNHDNLGRGELWDVESGVDYLIEQGYVDPEHVGCAGWSHGGFVAAFVGMHSDRFAAVSVGAGITNWTTYHATSDFHRFPEKVLGGLPCAIPESYQQASPATADSIKKTPTLVQHGDADSIVHFANAQELYSQLEAQGVPVELFRYPNMGHGVPNETPRAARAVMSQNLKWFCHHLLGQPLAWNHCDELE